eukprot:11184359-Prorocentrum_lima.AAC.1
MEPILRKLEKDSEVSMVRSGPFFIEVIFKRLKGKEHASRLKQLISDNDAANKVVLVPPYNPETNWSKQPARVIHRVIMEAIKESTCLLYTSPSPRDSTSS